LVPSPDPAQKEGLGHWRENLVEEQHIGEHLVLGRMTYIGCKDAVAATCVLACQAEAIGRAAMWVKGNRLRAMCVRGER
jgi:hypothetical protein